MKEDVRDTLMIIFLVVAVIFFILSFLTVVFDWSVKEQCVRTEGKSYIKFEQAPVIDFEYCGEVTEALKSIQKILEEREV